MSEHCATIRWSRGTQIFADNRYSRAHVWRFDGGAEVPGSSSPHVVREPYSDASAVDPEEAFVAALSSCHMLVFLGLAARAGFVVDEYADDASGSMSKNEHGKQYIARVTLRPKVAFSGDKRPSHDELVALHHGAHDDCFIANSVITTVERTPVST
ncbi:MAG: OsmC family protein [Candidatus Eremiobacteraeota bacterium]|nr:OsmC family protein [Candidatus Eremiobacteraeota bacterium]